MLCLALMDQTCEVAPFSDHYQPLQDVPIVTACTAYDNPLTGETLILIFHQVLWMGNTLKHSLISPNQVRSHGWSLCDDPYDPYRTLGITEPGEKQVKVPFDVQRGMVGTITRVPSWDEYNSCRHLVMTDDSPWQPDSEELDHNNNQTGDQMVINALMSSSHSTTPDPSPETDSYSAHLSTCGEGYTPDLLPRLISTIKV